MTGSSAAQELVAQELRDAETHWSVGTFGAIAEFLRDPDEPARLSTTEAVTDRGGIRLACPPETRAVAYETPAKHPDHWTHAIALCLPEGLCEMNRRAVLTEVGPDIEALIAQDRNATLFDMGLDLAQVDLCIRTADPGLLTALRGAVGRNVFEPGNPVMTAIVHAGPHRVFISKFGRAEVFQPIPPPDGRSPDGPHTHVLPKLLKSGRTHAATAPIPLGVVPCAHLYPRDPFKDVFGRAQSFDAARHERFQALLVRFGDPQLVALKREVWRWIAAGSDPERFETPQRRHARATVRVAIRQAKALGFEAASVARWRQAYDGSGARDDADDEG